jgi:hypothetical protein
MALYLFEMPSSLMSFRYINIYRVSVLIDIGNGTARQVSIIDPRQQQQQQCIMEMMSQTKKRNRGCPYLSCLSSMILFSLVLQ